MARKKIMRKSARKKSKAKVELAEPLALPEGRALKLARDVLGVLRDGELPVVKHQRIQGLCNNVLSEAGVVL